MLIVSPLDWEVNIRKDKVNGTWVMGVLYKINLEVLFLLRLTRSKIVSRVKKDSQNIA